MIVSYTFTPFFSLFLLHDAAVAEDYAPNLIFVLMRILL